MIFDYSILLAFVAMLLWGVGDFLIQKSVRKIGDLESLTFIGLIGTLALLPFVYSEIPLLFSWNNLALLLLLGLLTFAASMLNLEALKEGKLSVIDVIIELELPVVIFLGFFFFRETLTQSQAIAIGILLIGIFLIALKKFSLRNWFKKIEKGAVIALLAAVGMGLIDFLTAASSRNISPLLAIWIPWIIIGFISLFFVIRKKKLKTFIREGLNLKWIIIGMAVFDTVAWLAYAQAMSAHNIAIITAITESYPVIALFLGLWVNKEKIKKHQYLGAALTLVASFALAFWL